MKLSDLTPDNRNANKGTAKGQKAIVNSIQRSGAGRSIVVDKHGQIIGGNKTAEAIAEVFGAETEVQVIETDGKRLLVHKRTDLDLSDPSPNNPARQLAYADNLTSWASFQLDPAQVMADIEAGFDFEAVDISLPDLGELLGKAADELLAGDNAGQDTEPQIDKAEELRVKWGVEPGQLWQLGNHRMICGDCTDPAVVARVMGGERFDLMVTSPPYNSGDGGYKTDYNGKTKKFYRENTDNRTVNEWVEFCNNFLSVSSDYTTDDNSVIVFNVMYTAKNRDGYGRVVFGDSHPYTVKETICWDKKKGFPTASRGILSRNWELVFVLSKGERYNTTQGDNEPRWCKWEIARPDKQGEQHGATFPVDLPIRAISDFSENNSIVYEPFSGSGTTIIACENLGRRCRAIEIDPGYVAVALERWADHTGKTPELV